LVALVVLAGCGSSSGPKTPTIAPARTFKLVGTEPSAPIAARGPVELAFTVEQPSGQPLTRYRTGAGPHTGVHVIVVKDDLSTIIHRHPPIAVNGRVAERITFPSPGEYRVLADVYPRLSGPLRNFQLTYDVRVKGSSPVRPLPPFQAAQTVDGYHVVLHGKPKLRVARPAFLRITVTDPQGRPVVFKTWYGALAHAVFFHEGNLAYFHTHVCGPRTPGCTSILGNARVTGSSTTPGILRAGVLLPAAGVWRLFLQFNTGAKVITAPFTLTVSP
jgi:hypothetical protein